MNNNRNLHRAREVRNNEYYTKREDIDLELPAYDEHFRRATVYCNCDGLQSEFVRYFVDNFDRLKLDRLIATEYREGKCGKLLNIDHIPAGGCEFDEVVRRNLYATLEGDGDFSSMELDGLLDQADIVVTNPPFSKLTSFFPLLFRKRKKFLVISPLTAANRKSVGDRIGTGQIWLGGNSVGSFRCPDGRELKFGNIVWWTNLDHGNWPPPLSLSEWYRPWDYPTYDNLPAIEVSRVADIPRDYAGLMGVPSSFFMKWNPRQFDLLGQDRFLVPNGAFLNGRQVFSRMIIRNLSPEPPGVQQRDAGDGVAAGNTMTPPNRESTAEGPFRVAGAASGGRV